MSILVLMAGEHVLTPALEDEWLRRLPPARRLQLAARSDRAARSRSLIGARLLEWGIDELRGRNCGLSGLRYSTHGRGSLDAPLHFSASHAGGIVLYAVSDDCPVGVDIEPLGELTADEFLSYLSAQERMVASSDPARFYAVWTRKEAVVKAAGAAGLRQLPGVVTSADGSSASFAGSRWRTLAIDVGCDHVAHLALPEGEEPEVRILQFDRARLESSSFLPPVPTNLGSFEQAA